MPTTGPDQATLNGSCRARPMGYRPGPSMARLMVQTSLGPLPIVPGFARAGRVSAHLPWAKFLGLSMVDKNLHGYRI
jgi:hypothetical protein